MKGFRFCGFIILLFCSLSIVAVTIAGATVGGYTVEPVMPGTIDVHEDMTVPVNASEIPPHILLMAFTLTYLPIAAFPLELLMFAKLFTYLGYRKVSVKIVLENSIRNQIFSCIRDNPGIFFNSISRKTGIMPGTLRYHLVILNLLGKIISLNTFGNTRYFENSGKFSDEEKKILVFIQNDTDNRILRLLLNDPDISRKDLEARIGISGSTITWYIKRLSEARIIRVHKFGRYIRYRINPESRQYLEKYLAPGHEVITTPRSEKISDTS